MTDRVAIVTTKQPGTNPRMRKSADALASAGYKVHVFYAYNTPWADETDAELFQKATWNHTRIGGHPRYSKLRYQRKRLIRKCASWFNWTDLEFCPCLQSYYKALRQFDPQLVIGHNPGALPILTKWHNNTGKPVLFDAEDFHSGEHYEGSGEHKKMSGFESRHFGQLSRITAASPLIGNAYQDRFPHLSVTPINNAFDALLQPDFAPMTEGPLKLVWFSQVIGLDRGIQDVLSHLKTIPDLPIEITLIGTCDIATKCILEQSLSSDLHILNWCNPCSEPDLMALIAQHHIGLAIEPGFSTNNNIAWANKLFTYPLCGCWTLASRTPGQTQFYEEYPELGETWDLKNGAVWAKRLTELASSLKLLSGQRQKVWNIAKDQLNWEKESLKLLTVVDELIAS